MRQKNQIPTLIKESKSKNFTHVFLTVSPFTSLIFRMIVEKYSLDLNAIKVFSFRNTDTSLINFNVSSVSTKKYHRILEKFFWDSPIARKIKREIGNDQFILYSSWAFREAEWLINHKQCVGHIYIEEGQHSYMNIPSYNPLKVRILDKFKRNWNSRFSSNDEKGFYFRNDANAFIGISDKIFPAIPEDKKYYLDNLNEMKSYYTPKLIGINRIGLSCASRRINENNWDKMLKTLFKYVGKGGAIKIHPSFSATKKLRNKFEKTFQRMSTKNDYLCSDEIIIELEMLYEKKKIYGPKTSLSRYAKILGSEFIDIKLY